MSSHESTDVLETNFSQTSWRQNIFDSPLSSISARTEEDSTLSAIPSNLISSEIEFSAFDIRLPVFLDKVELIECTM